MSAEQLKQMFPSFDLSVLQSVLEECGNDMTKATDALLAMSTDAPAPGIAAAKMPIQPARRVDLSEIIRRVCSMPDDPKAVAIAKKYGLDIMNVAWEDNARFANSVWGPCISDMTLQVDDHCLPLIRYPNFADLTWDVPIDKVSVTVGNETGSNPYSVSLREYLEHFRMYLHNPASWKSQKTSLLAPRDSHVIISAQACFLPVPEGGESKFNVAIYNYQSSARDPAVLAIVVNSSGSSAQVLGNNEVWGGQKLFFNKNGQKASFIGQRLKDNRAERGVAAEGAMTAEEKKQNVLMIIQVPLKKRVRYERFHEPPAPLCCASASVAYDAVAEAMCDVDDAIIKVGESEGKFEEIRGLEIERDERYPIRVTLQFYKATSNGEINEEVVRTIADQLKEARANADFVGSLVLNPHSGRPTEHKHTSPIRVPPWWEPFWLTHKHRFSNWDEVFKTRPELADRTPEQAQHVIFSILCPAGIPHPRPPRPYPQPFICHEIPHDADER